MTLSTAHGEQKKRGMPGNEANGIAPPASNCLSHYSPPAIKMPNPSGEGEEVLHAYCTQGEGSEVWRLGMGH